MKIGGQAVIEGVMMRNNEKFSIAVRLPNKDIKLKKERSRTFPPFFKIFFIRGVIGLAYTLIDGIKALIWSGNQQMEQDEQMTTKELVGTIATSLLFGLVIFVGVPFLIAHSLTGSNLWFNIFDGLLRVVFFVAYLLIISKMKDVQTLYQYHGAEHKAIACNESNLPLNVENVQKHSTIHHRCGTAFLFLVLLMSIFLFSFITGAWWIKLGGRILLMPVIAGLSYELLKLGDKYQKNLIMRMLVTPGLWLQKITTSEPSNEQVEVAIHALNGVLDRK